MKRYWWSNLSDPHVQQMLRDPVNRKQAIEQGWQPPPDPPRLPSLSSPAPLDPTEPLPVLPGGLYADARKPEDRVRTAADRVLRRTGPPAVVVVMCRDESCALADCRWYVRANRGSDGVVLLALRHFPAIVSSAKRRFLAGSQSSPERVRTARGMT